MSDLSSAIEAPASGHGWNLGVFLFKKSHVHLRYQGPVQTPAGVSRDRHKLRISIRVLTGPMLGTSKGKRRAS